VDDFKKLKSQVQAPVLVSMLLVASISAGLYTLLSSYLELSTLIAAGSTAVVVTVLSAIASSSTAEKALMPVKTIWQAVLHIDPGHHTTPAPNLDKLQVGRELVNYIVLQVYQFASQENSKDLIEHRKQIIQSANVVNHMPLPLFVFNKNLVVTNASNSALEYCKTTSSELFGKSLFENLRLEFPSVLTLDSWVEECQNNKVTDTAYWERVHVLSKEDNSVMRQCDIAAYYNRDNASGAEFIVTLFDRTERYNQDDDQLSFVALAVHELRTPITMLRGYIEVLEEEVGDKLDDEMKQFIVKMEIAAKHLSSFVSNILNVARIDHNQLSLHLIEKPWKEVLTDSIADAQLRAKTRGKKIEVNIADNLPTVAVDPVSIYEVLNNLLENAIKYSGESKQIIINSSLNQEGLVETTVQDFGAGIPTSVLPNLFEKFSRNHRTRASISGTGLGLYLSKSIIDAHSGQIWASSKEDEGSTFGFTLQPYANLAGELKDSQNNEITRNAHGWIKNHSLYRR
jgi:signal transduction histidine kinase